jgi:hypothetical protein
MIGEDVRHERLQQEQASRREIFRTILGAGAVASGLAIAATSSAQAVRLSDTDVLNFALNLEYLTANLFAFAITGSGIPADAQSGSSAGGAQGDAIGGRRVSFTTQETLEYVSEIATDDLARVRFLRNQLGGNAIAQPTIDLGVTPASAFSRAAQAAGVVPAGAAFDVYADETSFLLGAYIFGDLAVTAYKGAARLIGNKDLLDAAAGILAVRAYNASTIRSALFAGTLIKPPAAGELNPITVTEQISDARDLLDGRDAPNETLGRGPDADQGLQTTTTADGEIGNLSPLNNRGLAYSRTPERVLNIAYLTASAASSGGFFPAGVNGAVRTSGAAN